MGTKIFCCQYTNKDGEFVTTNVVAYSETAAIRTVILKHPLAQDVRIVDPKGDGDGNANNRKPATQRMALVLIALIVVSLALVAALGMFFFFNRPSDVPVKDVSKQVSQNEVVNRYAEDYRNIVSISTKETRSTGFKVRTSTGVYLYTCFHCLVNADAIVCRDSQDCVMELGELELCEGRDLVRFALPNEKEGFELATKKDMKINMAVVAYGDSAGGGVMTQNKGKMLAFGNRKIEIDAEVLQGNSGGPVLNEHGKVIGVISSGKIDNSIWAKDTRYEKVRKFAERIDNGEWKPVSYEDFRNNFIFLHDTYVVVQEYREFIGKLSGKRWFESVVRPFVYDQNYLGDFGYARIIKQIYKGRDDAIEAERERMKKWDETNGKVGTRIQENAYYDIVKKRDSYVRLFRYTLPNQIFAFALEELKAMDINYFTAPRDDLIKDIETVLIPALEDTNKNLAEMERVSLEDYNKNYNKAR